MRFKVISSVIVLLSLTGLGTEVRANTSVQLSQFRPADTTEPAYREGGGTRSASIFNGGSGLIALTPVTGGVTMAEYPTLLVYVPQLEESLTNLSAKMGLKDEADNVVYETTIKLPTQESIIAININQDEASVPLKIDKTYRWYLSISSDNEVIELAEGTITRIELNSIFARNLRKANSQVRFNLYKNQGIWYEALHTLFELRRANPNDTTLIQEWQELLQSVGLEKIANVPLLLLDTPIFDNQPQDLQENLELDTPNSMNNETQSRPVTGTGGGNFRPASTSEPPEEPSSKDESSR